MQLRTFLAKDMKEALATVRADMGPDAVIIASEKSKTGGVMVRAAIDTPAKSLIRMLSPRGNPQARNLFGIIGYLQKQAGIELHVMPEPR